MTCASLRHASSSVLSNPAAEGKGQDAGAFPARVPGGGRAERPAGVPAAAAAQQRAPTHVHPFPSHGLSLPRHLHAPMRCLMPRLSPSETLLASLRISLSPAPPQDTIPAASDAFIYPDFTVFAASRSLSRCGSGPEKNSRQSPRFSSDSASGRARAQSRARDLRLSAARRPVAFVLIHTPSQPPL